MPIEKASQKSIHQVCAICGADRELDVDDLVLGASPGEGIAAPDVIVLPPCECGAIENLVRTWDHDEGSSHHAMHRRVVNGLCQELKRRGRSHPACKAHHDAETRGPPDIDELPDNGRAPIELPRVRVEAMERGR